MYGINGHGPSKSKPIVLITNPATIIDQWLLTLSATHPHIGLDNPYNAENSKNISPTCSGLKSNWKSST